MFNQRKTFRLVSSTLWDNRKFLALSDGARCLWMLLLTGPQVTALPGLQRGSVSTMADTMRRDPRLVAGWLDEIVGAGLAEYDQENRVVRLPNAPKHNPAMSPNHLKAWFGKWLDLPTCSLKHQHVESLREYASLDKESMRQVWSDGFGKVAVASQPNASSAFFARSHFEAPSKPLPKGSISPFEAPSEGLRENRDRDVDRKEDTHAHAHERAHAKVPSATPSSGTGTPAIQGVGAQAQVPAPANDTQPESGGERVVAQSPTLSTAQYTGTTIDDYLQEIVKGAGGKNVFVTQASAQLKQKLWEDVRTAGYTLKDFFALGVLLAKENRPKGIPADKKLSVSWLTSKPETLCRAITIAQEVYEQQARQATRRQVEKTPEELEHEAKRMAWVKESYARIAAKEKERLKALGGIAA